MICLGTVCGCSTDVAVRLLPESQQAGAGAAGQPASTAGQSVGAGGQTTERPDAAPLDWVLDFHGPYDHVRVDSSAALNVPQDFCVEAWIYVRSYIGGHGIFNRWIHGVGDIELTLGVPEPLGEAQLPLIAAVPSHTPAFWAYVREGLWLSVVTPTLPQLKVWHHIAGCYGGGLLKLYVDGTRVDELESMEPVANPASPVYIGATARTQVLIDESAGQKWWPPIDGYISQVRVSSTDRYPAEFMPEPYLLSDDQTLAFWALDEGQGDVAHDTGPQELHGSISGAHWVQVPARTGARD